jgi:hypothetical protein
MNPASGKPERMVAAGFVNAYVLPASRVAMNWYSQTADFAVALTVSSS